MAHASEVSHHYERADLLTKILSGLAASGISSEHISVDDLAPVDEFHTRGRRATLELTSMVNLCSSDYVLDVGCGLGGTARYLAHEYRCRVAGLDLTEEYIRVGKRLTHMVGLSERVSFTCGSALALPYEQNTFDMVWTEHAQMNIENKQQFYSEIARVLKPDGHFLFHDVFRSSEEPLKYPVPWAEDESISFLADTSEIRSLVAQASLKLSQWNEKTSDAVAFFNKVVQKLSTSGPPPVGIHLLMGENAAIKLKNYLHNLERGIVSVSMGVAQKQANTQ